MKQCRRCKVLFKTERKSCPLCFEVLKPLPGEDDFVGYPRPSRKPAAINVFVRLMTFFTVLTVTAAVVINAVTYRRYPHLWSLVAMIGVGYLWILIRKTFLGKSHIPMRLVIQMLMLSVLTYVIDIVFNSTGWSLDYVIPFLSMASIIPIIAMLFANRVKINDYLPTLFACVIFAFVPFILWLFDVVDVLWPSLAAASLAFATIVAMIVFADKETKEELKRRFHI